MPVILGHDASWTGWGYCLANETKPIEVGHVANLGNRSWRWSDLRRQLGELDALLTEAELLSGAELPRLAVEVIPPVYSGHGNQAATGQGLGQLTGPILLWGTRPGILAYPWELEPRDWRSWWKIAGRRNPKGRAGWKAWAVELVGILGWRHHLEPFPATGDDLGPRGDVAEAILIAVGAARHVAEAPRGPVRDPAWRVPPLIP